MFNRASVTTRLAGCSALILLATACGSNPKVQKSPAVPSQTARLSRRPPRRHRRSPIRFSR